MVIILPKVCADLQSEIMEKFSESELPLNQDGSVYHLHLKKGQLAQTIFLVSDPNYVHLFSQHFDKITFEMNQREFITHTGRYKGKDISVISTGIGVDNMEIVTQEADLIFNIDLKNRVRTNDITSLKFINLNLAESLQEDVAPGTKIVAEYAIGFDNLISFYQLEQHKDEKRLSGLLMESVRAEQRPYCVKGSGQLKEQFFDKETCIEGNVVTVPGFYAPRGRKLRLAPENKNFFRDLALFHSRSFWLTHFDLETAGLYAFARMLGHKAITISLISSNLATGKVARDVHHKFERFLHEIQEKI